MQPERRAAGVRANLKHGWLRRPSAYGLNPLRRSPKSKRERRPSERQRFATPRRPQKPPPPKP